MKCPKCLGKQQFRKSATKCTACGHEAALGGLEYDRLFMDAVRQASAGGTQFFAKPQLRTAFRRVGIKRRKTHFKAALAGFGFFGVIVFFVGMNSMSAMLGGWLPWAAVVAAGVLGLAWFTRSRTRPAIGDAGDLLLEEWLNTWRSDPKRQLELLLEAPSLHEPPPEWQEPDVYDYGAEGVLFVERDLLVDLFVRNGWHAEQRLIVLSEGGYPWYIAERIAKLLTDDPKLPVYVLHDPSAAGVGMLARLRKNPKFPLADRKITDLGLAPADVDQLGMPSALRAGRAPSDIPLEALPFGGMTSMVAASVVGGVVISELLAAELANAKNSPRFQSDFG